MVAVVLEGFVALYYLAIAAQIARVWRRIGRSPVCWSGRLGERVRILGAFAWPLLPLAWAGRPAWFAAVPRFAWLENRPALACGLLLVVAAVALAAAACRELGDRWRIGIDPSDRSGFVATGIYAFIRHPVYAGLWACLLGIFLLAPNIVFAVLWAAGSSAGAAQADAEERRMLEVYGKPYRDYALLTGKFFPLWY